MVFADAAAARKWISKFTADASAAKQKKINHNLLSIFVAAPSFWDASKKGKQSGKVSFSEFASHNALRKSTVAKHFPTVLRQFPHFPAVSCYVSLFLAPFSSFLLLFAIFGRFFAVF